uniref:ribosomal protein S4 n=1 Tax=Huperzia crispata TaxID=380486 RepID=UPI0023AB4857|nr:ribosomal protein S4 [Huperzia crispata]WCP18594.1 ribosomal protein S4 [Huperzia crispata]
MPASKFKTCRRISENVWQTKKLTQKQKHIILELPKKTKKRRSDFSIQLQNIQRLSLFYGKLPIKKIKRAKTHSYLNKGKSLLYYIEKRLDVILVRLNYCSTIFKARQLISHKNICVNYEMVNIPGFQVSKGDLISIKKNCLDSLKSNMRQNPKTNRIWRSIRYLRKTTPQWIWHTCKPTQNFEEKLKKLLNEKNYSLALLALKNKPTFLEKMIAREEIITALKPLHLEVNYKTLKAVVLYEPNKILFSYEQIMERDLEKYLLPEKDLEPLRSRNVAFFA